MKRATAGKMIRGATRAASPALRRRRAAGGFTLLELLIATAVGAVVLLVIQTVFFGALRLHTTTHARIDADLELGRALGVVRRDFAGLVIPGGVLAGHLQTTAFSSSLSDSIGERVGPELSTSAGRIDGWSPFADVQRVAYFLASSATDGNARAKDLVREVKRNLLPVQDEVGESQVLLHGVSEATIEFFDGAEWIDTWDSEATSTLPTALKLRLVLARADDGEPAGEPIELIVPVSVTTSASAAAAAAEATEGAGL